MTTLPTLALSVRQLEAPALTPSAVELLDLLSDRTKQVRKASNGRWYVTGRAGQVKESAVNQLIAAGYLIATDKRHDCYRRGECVA